MRRKLLSARKRFKWIWSGAGKPITNWRSLENSCEQSVMSSKKSWEWIYGWIGRWRGYASVTPLLITMMVGAAVGATVLVMALERNASYPIQDMRSVWVQKRVSPDIFKAFVQDPDTKSCHAWTFSSCHDYPITQEIQAGITLCV